MAQVATSYDKMFKSDALFILEYYRKKMLKQFWAFSLNRLFDSVCPVFLDSSS